MNSKTYLSIIVPAYNESKNFYSGTINSIHSYLNENYESFELIIVDDGSTDDTLALLTAFSQVDDRIKVIASPHQGKGPSLITGMLAAKGQYRLFTDFDESTPTSEVKDLLLQLKKGYDIAFGSRAMKSQKKIKSDSLRKLMGRVFNTFVSSLAVSGYYDTQCGFKLFSQEAAIKLFSSIHVYSAKQVGTQAYTGAIDVELLYLAKKFGFKAVEVPVNWSHVETDRVNPLLDSTKMLIDILKIRWADLSGKYQNAGVETQYKAA